MFIGAWLLLSTSAALAETAQAEINRQVWRTQMQGMREFDERKFMSVMSPDVMQVSYDRKVIRDRAAFEKQTADLYAKLRATRPQRGMEVRFTSRFASGNMAFETGFYKFTLVDKGVTKVFYGAVQSALRKENGIWKIVLDYDAESYGGQPVTAAMYEAAKPLEAFD
jgi:ketosteroid isomerase-like protein